MSTPSMIRVVLVGMIATLAACGDDGGTGTEPLGGSLRVTGDVVDFQTGAAITGGVTVAASGLVPAPQISTTGSSFEILAVPENSTFQILAAAPPTHRATFSHAVIVTTADVANVKAAAVSETYLSSLSTGFGVSPTAAKGVVFVQLLDPAGVPKAGVAAGNLTIAGGVIGPKFLDANLMPAPSATASSSSGWAVFFEVPAGVVILAQAAQANVSIDMVTSPVNAGAVTLAEAKITDGAPVLPTNVMFATQIFPIFTNRGCVACHSGGGIGKDLGGLTLDGSTNLVYKELTMERPGIRVNLTQPEASLVLTMPSREDPPDGHPNITFTGPSDPDYLKLLVWIREGAKDN